METEQSDVDLVGGETVRAVARAALLAALMGAAAFVSIPISAVPGTLQTLIVFLAALYLGPYWGGASMVLYLAVGAMGAPVFSGFSAGLGVLVGPTAGFLWTFPLGAVIAGFVIHRGGDLRDPASVPLPVVVAGLAIATAVIYVAGFGWYAWVTDTALAEAFAVVAAPLIPGDLLKMAAAIAIIRTGRIDIG
ncbi:biotin transporter BioY [Halosolutus halophilus]|uniref:biotin transporter BioY n=1 Tax=Halosolutus halophilus TaxID=1552990 RepID=UPI002234FF12|nr:biotin transporter BioY [Halosolutus halophilus]